MVDVTLTKLDGTTITKTVERPRYGGTINIPVAQQPVRFDNAHYTGASNSHIFLSMEGLLGGLWEKGPVGTNEATWAYGIWPMPGTERNTLAETWEIIPGEEFDLITYKIREGIHFHNKAPANGRELVAEDVAFCLRRLYNPIGYMRTAYPYLVGEPEEAIYATGRYTLEVKTTPGKSGLVWEKFGTWRDVPMIYPPELLDENEDLNKWELNIGTGPYMLVDFVPMSIEVYDRNPNYWGTHPMFPEDQMPYIDTVKFLNIPDKSTRLAALRSGKVDWLGGANTASGAVEWEDGALLKENFPDLKYIEFPPERAFGIAFRLDKEELPTSDVNVRKALSMAINRQEMLDTMWGGVGAFLTSPAAPVPDFADFYIPIEELPPAAKETFEYNPEKARQLLADAGYPTGFKTTITTYDAYVDWLSVVIEYWKAIGVEAELDIKEYSIYVTVTQSNKSYAEMAAHTSVCTGHAPFLLYHLSVGNLYNISFVDDPIIQQTKFDIADNYWDWDLKKQLVKDMIPHYLEQVYGIQVGGPASSYYWWPWLKLYEGSLGVGYWDNPNFMMWAWIDQDLKKEMTGR
jgi:peptide/nickel transport system substrate-binding protein